MKRFAPTEASLLDVKFLLLFELLYTTGRLNRAADELGQSHPTVSIWLAQMREILHDPLFVRTPTGMQPTPRADALIPKVRSALESIRSISDTPPEFDPGSSTRAFRICMTDASLVTILPILLGHLRMVAPDVEVEALRISPDTPGFLQSGQADLAVGLLPNLESGYYQQALFKQEWVCLANPKHSRICKSLSLDAYKNESHIGLVYGTGEQLLEAALKRHRVNRRVTVKMPTFLGLPAIILGSELIATVPSLIGGTLARVNGLNVFPCPLPVKSFVVKQHWHERYHHDPGNRWLREVCSSLFTDK